jgi:hypothetical protein
MVPSPLHLWHNFPSRKAPVPWHFEHWIFPELVLVKPSVTTSIMSLLRHFGHGLLICYFSIHCATNNNKPAPILEHLENTERYRQAPNSEHDREEEHRGSTDSSIALRARSDAGHACCQADRKGDRGKPRDTVKDRSPIAMCDR